MKCITFSWNNIIPPRDAVHLFATNDGVDAYNTKFLKQLSTESHVITAIDVVMGYAPENVKERLLKQVKQNPTKSNQGLPTEILAKLIARYMVTVNVDVADGLANGATGWLRYVSHGMNKNNKQVVNRVFLEFDDDEIGIITSTKYRNCYKNPSI